MFKKYLVTALLLSSSFALAQNEGRLEKVNNVSASAFSQSLFEHSILHSNFTFKSQSYQLSEEDFHHILLQSRDPEVRKASK